MPERPFDSSLTRVAPVFDVLRERDPTGCTWLPALLALPRHGHPQPAVLPAEPGPLQAAHWGADEKPLQPPVALLSWLIRHLPVQPASSEPSAPSAAAERRLRLYERDPATIASALTLLRSDPSPRGWWILEGLTYPDVFLESDDLVVVIEGKRTEPGPTTHTTWMPGRHQMLRHIDAAWEIRGNRPVAGLFVVEGDGDPPGPTVPALWREAAATTISDEALAASLPHRSPEERDGIARAFLGVTTWQAVCAALDVPPDRLIPRL